MTVGVDGHAAEQLAELLIAAHSQLKVAGHDTRGFLLSRAALPVSSRISAHTYPITAARYLLLDWCSISC